MSVNDMFALFLPIQRVRKLFSDHADYLPLPDGKKAFKLTHQLLSFKTVSQLSSGPTDCSSLPPTMVFRRG